MFGGLDGDGKYDDIWRFDIGLRTWGEVKAGEVKPEPRNGHSLIGYKGKLVLFGGI